MLSIEIIKEKLAPVFEKHGATKAVLFGSYAKGTATEKSDVDLVVDTELRGFDLMELYCDIQDALGGIALDMFARYELIPGGRSDLEVQKWGMTIYAV